MKIFISDLHISSPLFEKGPAVIELFNDPKVESIFILGDLFDTWEEKLEKTLEKHADLINVINNSPKTEVILKGNHDPDTEVMRDIFPNVFVADSYFTDLFGKDAILVHGDEFDGTDIWGRILFPGQYILERLGLNVKQFVRDNVYRFLRWKNNVDKQSLVFNMEKELVKKYAGDFDLIIAGHLHLPKIVETPDIVYANCGALIGKKSTYLIADKNTLTLERI